MAVSLDVVNAFGALLWQTVRADLEYHEVPPHMRDITEAYLCDRTVKLIDGNGMENRREVICGVSRLLSWNLAYDAVFRTSLFPDLSVVCYAFDPPHIG